MKIYKYIIVFFITISLNSCFNPGSYPYAERYGSEVSEQELINAVEKFRENNPEYYVPLEYYKNVGRRNKNDHWYHIYFYYKADNKVIYTWIRGGRNASTFAFVAIGDGANFNYSKLINNDFSRKENKKHKEQFERLIVSEIRKYVEEIKKNE